MLKSNSPIDNILLKFQLMQSEIKEMQENLNKLNTTMAKFYDLIDSVMGDFKKFNEEQDMLSGRMSDHSDRIEKLEEKAFGVAVV